MLHNGIFRICIFEFGCKHFSPRQLTCDTLSTSASQTYANASKISNLLAPKRTSFSGCMTPTLNRHMMFYATIIPSTSDSDATLCHWGSCWYRVRGGSEGRSLPKCSFLAGLFRHSAPELTSWAQRFLTQWCQTRDCDVQLTQVNSTAPHLLAICRHRHKQTYQIHLAIHAFGSVAIPNDTFALHIFIKEPFREKAFGICC